MLVYAKIFELKSRYGWDAEKIKAFLAENYLSKHTGETVREPSSSAY